MMLSFCLSWGDKMDVTHELPVAGSEAVAEDLFEIPSALGLGITGLQVESGKQNLQVLSQ